MATASGLIALAGFAAIPALHGPPPSQHAYGALVAVLAGYGALHAGVCAIASAYGWLRGRAGYVSPVRSLDVRAPRLFWQFTAGAGILLLALLYLPAMGGALA